MDCACTKVTPAVRKVAATGRVDRESVNQTQSSCVFYYAVVTDMDSRSSGSRVHFGEFEADLRSRELWSGGVKVRLQEQPFHVLSVLLQRPGELITREELRRQIWADNTYVDFDYALNTAVKKIRAALGDDAASPRFVETIPRRGYRFIATVDCEPHDTSLVNHPVGEVTSATPAWQRSWRALAFASVVVLLAGFLIARSMWPHPEHRIRLVVLPFDNLSGDPAQDYIAEGLTEELITFLGGTDPRRLGVTARSTANSYRHSRKTVREIGEELDAEYVLEGSMRDIGDQVRVSAQLIRVEDQSYIWADDFDHNNDDVVSAQSELAAAICHQVRAKLLSKPGEAGGLLSGAEAAASALK